MTKKKLLALFGSICLVLILVALLFLSACAEPAPAPAPAPAPEAEAEEEVPTSMAMLPGETPSQYRRRVRRFGGGTIVEGGGVLYK